MAEVCETYWERESDDDVPEYGVAVIYDGEHFKHLKYAPERTCRIVKTDNETEFVLSCGHAHHGIIPNFCSHCGAKVVG